MPGRLLGFVSQRLTPKVNQEFLDHVLTGLGTSPKRISPKYFYDHEGSLLFEEITRQPEYYLTNVEIDILSTNASSIADAIGENATLIEYGSGASKKIRILLDHLKKPNAYVPIDISKSFLNASVATLSKMYPNIRIHGVSGDYMKGVKLPADLAAQEHQKTVFFPRIHDWQY